ncbi:protein associated with differentiation 4 [Lotmaria passim]
MTEAHTSALHLNVLAAGPQRRVSEVHRFALLMIGSIGMICSSFGYAFSLVVPSLQTKYNFTQRETASITCVGLVFGYCMLPFAFLFDYLGPLPIALLSVVMYPLGCVLTALSYENVIKGTVVRLCVFNALQNIGVSLSDLVCCMTVLSYFPANRGPVVALLKTCIGLGSAIVGSLYTGFFGRALAHYLYFLAALSFTVNVISALTMRLASYQLTGYEEAQLSAAEKERRVARKAQYLKQKPVMWRFGFGFVVLIALIIYLPTTSALIAYHSLDKQYRLAFGVVTAVLTSLFFVVAIPLPKALTQRVSWCRRENDSDDEDDEADKAERTAEKVLADDVFALENDHRRSRSCISEDEPCQPEKRAMQVEDGMLEHSDFNSGDERNNNNRSQVIETDVDYLAPQYQGPFLHNLKTLELWALWWTLFCVIGTEFVIIYNASFLLGALQGSKPSISLTALLTVLNGVGSAAGRLLMSAFEVWSQKRKAEDRIPITIALFFPTTSIIVAIILFLVLPAAALPLPYVVAAFGNGFCAASQILVTRTIFAKDPAKHYHFCFSSTMVATIVLNRFLYGEWYTVQAEKQHRGNNLCFGKQCVLVPLCVLLGLACSAFITDVILHLRYRAYSLKVLAERAHLRGEAAPLKGAAEEGSELCPLDDGLLTAETAADAGTKKADRTT